MSGFNNKTAVITGGAGVLCSEIAKALAKEGASVVLLGRTESSLQQVVEDITAAGGSALAVPTDVLNVDELKLAREKVNAAFGSCDILINGAGGNHPKGTTTKPFFYPSDLDSDERTFFDLDPDGVNHVFNLNFMGTFLPTQVFAQDMVGKDDCSILNVSSVSAAKALTKVSSYSAAKAAISNFTQWLAVNLSKQGIRVNALAPGFFLTEQNRSLLTMENGSHTERGKSIIDHTPMGRFGNPEDLIGGVLWICGDNAKFVTGIVLHIDGGFTAYSGI